MAEDNKNYNLTLVGPDTIEGQGPTESPNLVLPEPGPDTEYFYDERNSPGYKLGCYLNVYHFDHIINRILDCDDWASCFHAIKKEYFNGSCMVSEIVGYENFLSIDKPEENNIPRNVMVLLQKGMIRGDYEPDGPDSLNSHFHYSNTVTQEAKRRGWYISDDLKLILEEVYNWKFFEDVVLEANLPDDVFAQVNNDTWDGGVEQELMDVHYHDLRWALDDSLNLSTSPEEDNRVMGEKLNVLALFSYVMTDEAFVDVSATATLAGDCDTGFYSNIEWESVTPFNPDVGVLSYSVYFERDELSEKELLGTLTNDGQEYFGFIHELDEEPTGVQGYPKYYISWKADESSTSPFYSVSKLPGSFTEYGVPSCQGADVSLSIASVGQCWTPEYGEVELSWNISLPVDSSISELKLVKTKGSQTTEYILETDVRRFTDEGNVFEPSGDNTVSYHVEVLIDSLATGGTIDSIQTLEVPHVIELCVCDDEPDICADKCWIRQVVPSSCNPDIETTPFHPEVLLWMENYSEDPFSESPTAQFDIRYCIANKCAEGLASFSLSLVMPEGFRILEVQTDSGGEDVEVQSVFGGGLTKDRWDISSEPSWSPLPPTHGKLCRVVIDKPIGTNRIEFIPSLCEVTVSEGSSDLSYNWDNNAQNSQISVGARKWQAGPPLSICTDEVDMGYGDYLLDLQAVDLKTFDVNFCLSRDDFDTFILVVMNTDFTTEIESVDQVIGLAMNSGWNVTHRNIAPGMSVIMGNGSSTIPASGYETLLRVVLSDSSINRDIDSCVCVFPFFLKIGDLWNTLRNMSGNFDANNNQNSGSYSTNAAYGPQTYALAATPMMMAYTPQTNPVVMGLNKIADNIDPRFKEIVCCISDAYQKFLIKADNPATAASISTEDLYRVTYTTQLFVMMITMFSSLSIAKSNEINAQLDNIADLGEALCSNYLILEADGSNGDFDITVKYSFPSAYVAGVQFEINVPEGFAINRNGLEGDAKDKKFLQVLGTNGAYIAVYDYGISGRSKGKSSGAAYLSSTPDAAPTVLTSFKLQYVGEGTAPTLEELKSALGIVVSGPTEIKTAKLVTNITRTDPSRKWNGDWYNVDQAGEVNIRDFLVSCILCSGGSGDLPFPDEVIVLPDGETVSTKYFGGNSYNLSNITYNPETFIGRDDENFQEYMLDFFDANGDGVADITDVVTVRNLFHALGKTNATRQEANNIKNIVPTEICTLNGGIDLEFYVPDECSDFCVKPKCFSKIWISDIIQTSKSILLEISYSTECDEMSISGAQFKISGLTNGGINGCVKGERDSSDVFSEKDWDFHVVSSTGTPLKDTVIAHATTGDDYVGPGSGVLTYVSLQNDAVYGLTAPEEMYSSFIKTNGYTLTSIATTNPKLGVSAFSPMDSLYAMHRPSSEILSFRKFGLRVSSGFMTTNENLQEVSETFDVTMEPQTCVNLYSTNGYSASCDANDDGKINLIDVQSAFHLKHADRFGVTGSEALPIVCCPCDLPEDFKLVVGDFSTRDADGNPNLFLSSDSGWKNDRSFSVARLSCGSKTEGGIILAWTNSIGADYYVVYRKSSKPGARPIPIIGSKTGVIANTNSFHAGNSKTSVRNTPVQIDSTVWVDFPPADPTVCCEWCPDDEEGCTPDTVATKYEYYVVAHNDCGETKTNTEAGSIPCCNFPPVVEDEYITLPGGVTLNGFFDVKTKEPSNVYIFTTTGGVSDETEQGGTFEVTSGAPVDVYGRVGSPNSFGYRYTPPDGFFGKDRIKFYAYLQNPKAARWSDWCSDEGEVNIVVYPPPTTVRGRGGHCGDSDERGTALIRWEPVAGVDHYKIFRDGVEIARANPNQKTFQDIEIVELTQENCDLPNRSFEYGVAPCFIYNDQELYSEMKTYKIEVQCCGEIENPKITATIKRKICDENNNRQRGAVEISWEDLGDFDDYNVYKRTSENYTDWSDWTLIASLTEQTQSKTNERVRFLDDRVNSCGGCGVLYIEYFVESVVIGNKGSEMPEHGELVKFECCRSNPVAIDQEFTTEGSQRIVNQRLKAYDRDADIVSYAQISPTIDPPEAGYIFDFNEERGTFSFQPSLNYEGLAAFDWEVEDSCGGTDTATVTLTLHNPEECNEDNYVICNATLNYLTDQHTGNPNTRRKIDDLPQVPFSLNNKGVPSLRKRCGAYSATTSINPSTFAIPAEGCLFVKLVNTVLDLLPVVSMYTSEDDIFFNECKEKKIDGIPAVVVSCDGEIDFSDCKPFTIDGIPPTNVECGDEIEVGECKPEVIDSVGEVTMSCAQDENFGECEEEEEDKLRTVNVMNTENDGEED